jgi:hypothetical protein
MPTAVDHLKKISLELQFESRTAGHQFVFGVASEGLCPFEQELLHRLAGERLRLSIPGDRAAETFAHLYRPIRLALQLTDLPNVLDLSVSITSVSDPEPREVIRAMAQATEENGCHGDCGCGCSGH